VSRGDKWNAVEKIGVKSNKGNPGAGLSNQVIQVALSVKKKGNQGLVTPF
jgi:hypothetical protein